MEVYRKLSFINKSNNPNPEYANSGDSGFDLRAWIKEEETNIKLTREVDGKIVTSPTILLQPLERKLIHTGLYFDIPENFEVQIRPRSGMALKKGLSVLNTPGTVDTLYRGEICIIAINLSNEPIQISSGDRIAQAVIMPREIVCLCEVEEINSETQRGQNGMGSSGFK